jgi:prepilin-type N-terminal cleavage/methylation domain-containing protein
MVAAMPQPERWRYMSKNRGFSLLELVVVLTIIGVLIAIALDKLPVWQAEAERTAMESVTGSLRSALGIKVASYIVQNDMAGIRALAGSNPMEQLAETPNNYLGVKGGAERAVVGGGNWFFDASTRQLVYRVRNAEVPGAPGVSGEVRFEVQLVFEDRNRNGFYEAAIDRLNGVRLAEVQSYAWSGLSR